MNPPLYLWHLSQKENTDYDSYDSIVVAAYTEEEAKKIHPRENLKYYEFNIIYDIKNDIWLREEKLSKFDNNTCKYIEHVYFIKYEDSGWAISAKNVIAKCVGVAFQNVIKPREIICRSFNAG